MHCLERVILYQGRFRGGTSTKEQVHGSSTLHVDNCYPYSWTDYANHLFLLEIRLERLLSTNTCVAASNLSQGSISTIT